jgi:hypothetical protein
VHATVQPEREAEFTVSGTITRHVRTGILVNVTAHYPRTSSGREAVVEYLEVILFKFERIEYDLLFRWFVGLGIEDPVWDATTFSPRTATGCWKARWHSSFSPPC